MIFMRHSTDHIAVICGARPNFMKVAPLCAAFVREGISHVLVNTGQHFSKEMAADFFDEFQLEPTYHLPSSEGLSTCAQFAHIMQELESVFLKEQPSLVLVVGDVNSTLVGALVANKMQIPLGHIEAGLRSHNWKMPEEANRVLTDTLSDFLFVPSEEAVENLRRESIVDGVHVVGNIMIDTLQLFIKNGKPPTEGRYYFATLHRAENVDDPVVFDQILSACDELRRDAQIFLPLHPRTKKMAQQYGYLERLGRIFTLLPPLSYGESLAYQKHATLVLTDSGGIQEETSFLGVPCLTIRTETERPITVELGTNTIAGVSRESILDAYRRVDLKKRTTTIPLWDGKTSERIIDILKEV